MSGPPQECVVDSSGIHNCMECGLEEPEWIIWRPGVKVCPECSGVHRSLRNEASTGNEEVVTPLPEMDTDDELPSSSDDAVPPMDLEGDPDFEYELVERSEVDDGETDDGDEGAAYQLPPGSLGHATIGLIAKSWKPRVLRADEDPERVHKEFYDQFMAIPNHERIFFLSEIDSMCYEYFKHNAV
ncbi:uncharacterized protein LOC115440572 [Manduca sexta]|uniref:uncharacterized protein LOC115440572 n=1 Tax=Manduca sexta TaxID=7130 RepID=UPI00188E13DC|nr:uncharacterized protein LOC115440572 [Manduca sexta]